MKIECGILNSRFSTNKSDVCGDKLGYLESGDFLKYTHNGSHSINIFRVIGTNGQESKRSGSELHTYIQHWFNMGNHDGPQLIYLG